MEEKNETQGEDTEEIIQQKDEISVGYDEMHLIVHYKPVIKDYSLIGDRKFLMQWQKTKSSTEQKKLHLPLGSNTESSSFKSKPRIFLKTRQKE